MPDVRKLDKSELQSALTTLEGWTLAEGKLHREYKFPDFVHAFGFMATSAIAIEKARLYERVVDVEEQLRQNEKLSALGLLAAEVAHEIRNPLTVMKMLYHSLGLDFPASDPRLGTQAELLRSEKMASMGRWKNSLSRNVNSRPGLKSPRSIYPTVW